MAELYRLLSQHLRNAGCSVKRQGKGSHEIWFSPVSGRTFSVPANIKSRRLANQILKEAGLTKVF